MRIVRIQKYVFLCYSYMFNILQKGIETKEIIITI
jgi:hypothetical protein